MGTLYQQTHEYITEIEPDTVMVEIGSDRGEGSTLYYANLAEKNNIKLHTVDVLPNSKISAQNASIEWHTCIGSEWCKNIYPSINKKISVMYLDNFDYLWDNDRNDSRIDPDLWNKTTYDAIKGVDWPQDFCEYTDLPKQYQDEVTFPLTYNDMMDEMRTQYRKFGFNLTNSECQLEHFKQLFYLIPYLAEECIVVFDDTFRANDCWIGKNGPGVVLLQTIGFKIVAEDKTSVILKRHR